MLHSPSSGPLLGTARVVLVLADVLPAARRCLVRRPDRRLAGIGPPGVRGRLLVGGRGDRPARGVGRLGRLPLLALDRTGGGADVRAVPVQILLTVDVGGLPAPLVR